MQSTNKNCRQEHRTFDISFPSEIYYQRLFFACAAGAKRWGEGRGGMGRKARKGNPWPSSPLLFRRLLRMLTAFGDAHKSSLTTSYQQREGKGGKKSAKGKIPFPPLPSSLDACHVGPQLRTYHSISTTGRESLCSLLCALRRNIRYSSGEAPGIVDTVLVKMANSVSSGR